MPLFLVTSLYNEGISPNLFRVMEAESKLVIAEHMPEHPDQWGYFLYRAFHQDWVDATLTPEQLLEQIDRNQVNGDLLALWISDINVQALGRVLKWRGSHRESTFDLWV